MGTITARKGKNGKRYTAQIRIKRDGKIVHTESLTRGVRKDVSDWMKRRELELAQPGALDALKKKPEDKTLADAIDQYLESHKKGIGRTKNQVLRTTKEYPLADKLCQEITSHDVVSFAETLSGKRGLQAATITSYLSHLSEVFSVAGDAWGFALDDAEFAKARKALKRIGLMGKGKARTRRPSLDELDRILTGFARAEEIYPDSMPMTKIVVFAIFSTRRQEEITRIVRADFEEKHERIMVRDMKHPGKKDGNDTWCDLTPEAIRVLNSQPQEFELFFPYNHRTVSSRFTRMCRFLEIEDLHFHDLRHEGISRLFEIGYTIPRAASVSGHRSWSSLQRYSHIRQTGDKYKGWKWLDIVCGS
ncbi:site-specific tyrosine recombinase XerC [Labrenzia sp. THAF35]|uniref:site-specific integrase n=1 Tax=Labrenzia sp. THAF35 TaxID=2587854 RepID=UPI0012693A51|nr:tyrosine-type recombinase/integrase [Labrenzia sp. THAF35]QFT69580.1 site-specific tyrosine recombinase XerC [Labrenzia sp. THAF35]